MNDTIVPRGSINEPQSTGRVHDGSGLGRNVMDGGQHPRNQQGDSGLRVQDRGSGPQNPEPRNALPSSNSYTITIPDSIGFVPIEEIQNVFTKAMQDIENRLRQLLPTIEARGELAHVIDVIDDIRGRLMKRARDNLVAYIRQNPTVIQNHRQKLNEESQEHNHKVHQQRMALGKTIGMRDV
jgi:hypothetical protein